MNTRYIKWRNGGDRQFSAVIAGDFCPREQNCADLVERVDDPTVLADLGITNGKNATCYPGCEENMGSANMLPDAACVRDGKLITAASAGCAVKFGLALIAALKGDAVAAAVEAQIVIR